MGATAGVERHCSCLGCFAWAGTARSASRSSTGTPLPRKLHRRVARSEICRSAGGRLIIVGDVHGCASELQSLLKQENFERQRDTLVLIGDLVNKGPRSKEVIEVARSHDALCIRGNHDDELLEAYHRVGRYSQGLQNYKFGVAQQITEAEAEWLRELPLTLSFPWLELTIVHAGLVPGVPLEEQTFKHMTCLRDVRRSETGAWEGLESPEVGSEPWAGAWAGPEHIVFGHDAMRKLQERPFATGLDTGCCYGYHLTALVVDPDDFLKRRIVQIPAEQVHSKPNVKTG